MIYFVALLVFILVYVISKLLLSSVESLKGVAEVLGLVLGALAALVVVGAVHL